MPEDKIHKDMNFGDLLRRYPKAGPILSGHGLHCIGCHIAVSETIAQGARAHGMDDTAIQKLVDELNQKALA